MLVHYIILIIKKKKKNKEFNLTKDATHALEFEINS